MPATKNSKPAVTTVKTPVSKPTAAENKARRAEVLTNIVTKAKPVVAVKTPVTVPVVAVKAEMTPADVKKVTTLEGMAGKFLAAAVTDSGKLAGTLVKLYSFAPWKLHKVTLKAYYESLGITADNYVMPTVARRALVTAMYKGTEETGDGETAVAAVDAVAPNAPVEHIMAMTGASKATVARDRRELGLVSEARSDGNKGKHAGDSDDSEPAKPAATVNVAPAGVHKVVSIPEFLATLDIDSLMMVITLASERIAELESAGNSDDDESDDDENAA